MSGHGGYKHRKVKRHGQESRTAQKARASVAKVRGIFEAKGQAWDPKNNPAQMAALTHDGRRLVLKTEYANF